jgi:hypothetical protein
MASPNQILGRATVTIDGTRISTKQGEATSDASTIERQPEMGEYGPEGFSEKAKAGTLKFRVYAKQGLTAAKLWALVDTTAVFEGDNGYTATYVQATTTKVGEIKSGEGAGFEVEMFAMRVNEA